MMADVEMEQGNLGEMVERFPWGFHMGEARLRGDFDSSELGQYDGAWELEEGPRDWMQVDVSDDEGVSQPVQDEADEPEVFIDDILSVIEEDSSSAAQNSIVDEGSDKTMLLLGPPVSQQEMEIAPHTPAVPEGHYDVDPAPSLYQTTPDLSWQHDLNGNGEAGLEDTSDEILSLDNIGRGTIWYFIEPTQDLDYERPQKNDGSVLVSNRTYLERLSPGVSRPSRSTSSSPVTMLDNSSRHEYVFENPFERKSMIPSTRELNFNGHPIVDLSSDDSDGVEEESELRELNSGLRRKRNLLSWGGGGMKRPRESIHRDTFSSSWISLATRTSSGEVSTSYDRRVLPGTMANSITGSINGTVIAAAVDPVKRSEELAIQAVVQAFSLGDEKEEATPDQDLLTMTLLKHQRIALAWMVNRESGSHEPCGGILADDQGLGKTISTISLILKNRAPVQKSGSSSVQSLRPEGSTVDLEDYEDEEEQASQERKLETRQCSSSPNENGSQQQLDDPRSSQSSNKGRPAAGTLVVCPTSVLRQWAQEIRDKVATKAGLSVLVYHGSNRIKDPQEIAKFDVVLSTYSIVSMEVPKQALPEERDEENRRNGSEYEFVPFTKPKKEKAKKGKVKGKGAGADGDTPDSGPLARVAWFRVVLDEAQSIKNYRTQVSRAAWGLRAKRRWCLSGTPIQNSVDDLFSYFRFLRYSPWDAYEKFQRDIKEPVGRNPSEGYKKLQAILKPVVLRRTKTSLLDGKPIVNLPPRIVKLQQAEFSLDERSFYENLEIESREQFQMYAAAGTVQNNYVNILWMLLRLRQACDHPMLVKKCAKGEAFQKTTIDAVRKLPLSLRSELIQCLEGGRTICHVCQDAPEDPVVSICAHVFCRQCISEQMNGDETCPSPKCKRSLNNSSLFTLSALKDLGVGGVENLGNEVKSIEPAVTEVEQTWNTSSKIDAMMNTLQALPKISVLVEDGKIVEGSKAELLLKSEALEIEQGETLGTGLREVSESIKIEKVDSTEKAIVFSQWTSMLDLLELPLKKSGLCYRRLDGTMSVVARDRAVSDFNTLPEVTVMIMSLKAASLGLNMVAASHVLLLDVWWNPTTEDQAIDRAHRIGQTRTVNVSRFTVKNTIEDRILALQERKRQIVASAFGENDGGEQKNRLTVEDLRYLFRV
ncbi:helicase-like transcription factor CHR28 isoform X2 [Physcomitrium patens]|uniref:SNF2 family DNA-dependent ATPase n=1 Tax=Physcomitrium patens TaxID=3218 RepID=A0A7I4BGY7_PHYPA|nr:helicase-like transcription factor CHR28 isoform X2 [Physcomitrium patens]|eukprot:XP_024402469.1 helicase-like transcription factor CHR28 isoform X2 [Physcomitrella patens]